VVLFGGLGCEGIAERNHNLRPARSISNKAFWTKKASKIILISSAKKQGKIQRYSGGFFLDKGKKRAERRC